MRVFEMKLSIALLLLFMPGQGAWAEEESFYIGAVSDLSPTMSRGIYLGRLDTETGKLGALTLASAAKNPGFLALSPDRKFLYAAGGSGSRRSWYRRMVRCIRLTSNLQAAMADPCRYRRNRAAYFLSPITVAATSYAWASTATVRWAGRPPRCPLRDRVPTPCGRPSPTAHSVYADPENKFVYACDLGSDHIWIFRFDAAHGTLTLNDPPSTKVPPGCGPRHLAFSPKGDFVYVANEMGNSVSVFARDAKKGGLTEVETVPTLLSGKAEEGVTTAEIVLHPSGRWLYVSNRGIETISVFARGADGRLKLAQSVPAAAKFPRSFAVDPSGGWLLVAGQKDNRLALLKIDPATGRLTNTDQFIEAGTPFCVLFVSKN